MKNFRTPFIILFAVVIFYSCKKEATALSTSSAESSSLEAIITDGKWVGEYIAYNNYYPASRNFKDKFFIANGYARLYTDSVNIYPNNYYYTQIHLKIPAVLDIDGDNITLEAGVKNPANSTFYIPYHGRDVGIKIMGTTDSARISNVVPDSIRPDAHKYAVMQFGNNIVNNVTELQYLFEDWGTLVLQTFNNGLVAYRNNEYLKGLPYNDQPKIGRLREIIIGFKGSGYVDWVKLYNSATGELILSEDFNTNGESTVVLY